MWSDADGTMRRFIYRVDLDEPVNQAIASTIVDPNGLTVLRERAASGDVNAQAIFEAQTRFLGGITFEEHGSSSGPRMEPQAQPVLPSPEDYTPERFKDYLESLG